MKAIITANGKSAEITLTAAQEKAFNNITTPVTDRIKTFEDACDALGLDADDELPYSSNTTSDRQKGINAFAKLQIIADALNEGWVADWSNTSQYKYYSWFNLDDKSSGLGLSYDVFGSDLSDSFVGSRLCFKSKDLAKYAAEQFAEIYRDFMKK